MNILLSIDSSEHINPLYKNIISFLKLNSSTKFEIDIFHSYELPTVRGKNLPSTFDDLVSSEKRDQKEFITTLEKELITELNEHNDINFEIDTVLKKGDYIKKVKRQLEKKEYDLLILLPLGRDLLEKFFRKNKIYQLMEFVEIPVLILPKNESIYSSVNLIGLVDNRGTYDSIRDLKIFSETTESHKSLIHFSDTGTSDLPADVKIIEKPTMEYVEQNSQQDSLNLYIAKHQRDSDFFSFLRDSFTKNLLSVSDISLIII